MSIINITLIKKNPLCIPTIMASKMGIFKKHNIEVNLELPEDFDFGGKNPFLEGDSHAMMGDVTFFFYTLKRGKKAVITSNLTRTISFLASKDVPKDLSGLTVGVNRAGLFKLFLENDLKNKLKDTKITWINNTYERIKAIDNGEIDALVAIEPFIGELIDRGYEKVWSLRESDKNLVMWCFEEEFYRENKEAVKSFHKALEEAKVIFNESSKEEKVNIVIDYAGYSLNAAKRLEDFTFEKGEAFREEDFNLCQEWMYREGDIDRLYNPKDLIIKDTFI
ncbi:ABC transporter substrate-binding protein [Clostridium sardiniense]|uniref:ABC transporter substrate-binding protein n=1 Tax=Clostridium sardiniense TaxID=29369 RepID=UPI003D349748